MQSIMICDEVYCANASFKKIFLKTFEDFKAVELLLFCEFFESFQNKNVTRIFKRTAVWINNSIIFQGRNDKMLADLPGTFR